MKAPVNKDQQLEELYKLVPDVHCKGFCQLECRALAKERWNMCVSENGSD